MAVFDLTKQKNNLQSAPIQIGANRWVRKIKIKGSDITSLSTTATDNFKILNLGQKVRVVNHSVIVLDADDTAITMKSGYTDGTNTDDDAYDADVALNAAAVTTAMDNDKFLYDAAVGADFFLILTFSALTTLDDATEFIVVVEGENYHDVPFDATVNAPV